MSQPKRPRRDSIPDAVPVSVDADSDWVLGAEATVPAGDYGPPIPSRFPHPLAMGSAMGSEIRELERRVRDKLTPLFPLKASRKVPFQFLWSRYRRLAMRNRSSAVDDYGRDPVLAARLEPALDFLTRRYFRIDVSGIGNIPASGPAILVVNHSGALPYDALLVMHAIRQRHPNHRVLRPLIEDFLFHAPYIGLLLNRLGAVRACPENALRLLDGGHLVAVFPEGEKGPSKLYKSRYRLERFGRGGFVKLALRAGVPLIPVAVVGAEETHPMLGKLTRLTKTVGMPYVPLTPTFPWLGPLGLVPLPSKWSITIGTPIDLRAQHSADAADDRLLVGRLTGEIRDQIQSMLDRSLAARGSVFFG